MTTTVHILTEGFKTPNGRAFLFPLLCNLRALDERGIQLKFFLSPEKNICECDVLLVENKYFGKRWAADSDGVVAELAKYSATGIKLFYFDITDSSGWDHARALSVVTVYLKNQLLIDRSAYLAPHYGHRIFCDHYHRHNGVEDKNGASSEPVADPQLLKKLHVGWNSGLADWSRWGPTRMGMFSRIGWPKALLASRRNFTQPSAKRPLELSCRFGVSYERDTVAFQRQSIARIMADRLATDKLGRSDYFKEMQQARTVISPFGLGEITLKDFEVFMTGALLFKPDMSHMETWPNFFVAGETMVTHKWNLEDFLEQLDDINTNYQKYLEIAVAGQERYRDFIEGSAGETNFCDHFARLLRLG